MNGVQLNNEARAKWLRMRKDGIGSSDAACILGVGYVTPEQLYREKISNVIQPREMNERMRLGLVLEADIAEQYTLKTGNVLTIPPTLIRRGGREWQLASLDRIAPTAKKIVECKAIFEYPGGEWGEEGSDQIPEKYLIQVQHQMGVSGIYDCDVAAMFVGHSLRVYHVPFDLPTYEMLTHAEAEFWGFVQRGEGLPDDWTPALASDIFRRCRRVVDGKEIALDDEASHYVSAYREAQKLLKEDKETVDRCKTILLDMMGDAEVAHLPDGSRMTRKKVHRKAYTVEPYDYIDFRIKSPRKGKNHDASSD